MLRYILCFFLVLSPAFADPYPKPLTPFVSDFAQIIGPESQERVTNALTDLRETHGIEMAVVTIRSRDDFDPSDSIEAFATAMFNGWGIGDAQKNDGILVLVAHQDREMRVELGSGYDRNWDKEAARVIDDLFLPHFRNDNYSRGIETGTLGAIDRIALPFAAGTPAPEGGGSGGSAGLWIGIALALGVALLIFKRSIGNLMTRAKRCPNCGKRHLRRRFETLAKATKTAAGEGLRETRCGNCDWHDSHRYTISRISSSSSSGSSFGGGSSSGGGASGKW